jgi:tetratricopeptide (TPR) repeat protein
MSRYALLACAATIAFVCPAGLHAADVSKHCAIPTDAMRAQVAAATASYEDAEPPLWDNLGSATYPITTRNPQAQAFFDQGLKLSYGFNHAEARRAFRMAQKLDPTCALCFWGEALVLGPNINVPMMPEAQAPALAALKQAQALAAGASAKERALIAALAKRYSETPPADRAPLDGAYADAMAALSDAYPDDLDIAALAAEAAMDTQPWDYWQPGGHDPKGRAGDAIKRIEGILAKDPLHAGAIHLYIHLVEASDRPERAEKYADTLAALMPGAGHIVHMPSHIYYRIGRYDDSLTLNEAAVKVDEAYLAQTGAVGGVYPLGYTSHNIHFVLVSAQLLGDKATVLAAADKLDGWIGNDVAAAIPIAQPIKAAPYFAWAQFADADKLVALPQPAGAPPYVEAMWHYARGVGLAEKGDAAGARDEAGKIEALEKTADWSAMDQFAIPARDILRVAQNVVLARAAQAKGDPAESITYFQAAAGVQDSLPYMEPPYWYYPVRQSLGAALLKAGRAKEAADQFRTALDGARKSAWALFGLREAAKATGDAATEQQAADELAKSWRGDPGFLSLERL